MKKKSSSHSAPARRPVLRPDAIGTAEGGSLGEAGLPAVASREGGFLNLRVLFGLCVVLAGVFLALVSFGTFSSVFAQTNQTNAIQQGFQSANNAPGTGLMLADLNLNALLAAHPPRVVSGNPAEGSSGPQAPAPNEAWGSQQGATWIAATQFVRTSAASPVLVFAGGTPLYFYAPGVGPTAYVAQLTVEPGRRINEIRCAYDDVGAVNDISFVWIRYTTNISTGATTPLIMDTFASSGAPTYGSGSLTPPPGEETMHVWDGTASVINHFIVATPANDLAFAGCLVFSQRQVAPASGPATFTDVPTSSPWFPYVEALVDTGVTGGCAPGLYCPNDPVTRGQMATFLAKALGMGFPF
jgi:S-layer homology domain